MKQTMLFVATSLVLVAALLAHAQTNKSVTAPDRKIVAYARAISEAQATQADAEAEWKRITGHNQSSSTSASKLPLPSGQGRYQLIETKALTFRFDTETGRTWAYLPTQSPQGVRQFGEWIPVGEP